ERICQEHLFCKVVERAKLLDVFLILPRKLSYKSLAYPNQLRQYHSLEANRYYRLIGLLERCDLQLNHVYLRKNDHPLIKQLSPLSLFRLIWKKQTASPAFLARL